MEKADAKKPAKKEPKKVVPKAPKPSGKKPAAKKPVKQAPPPKPPKQAKPEAAIEAAPEPTVAPSNICPQCRGTLQISTFRSSEPGAPPKVIQLCPNCQYRRTP